MLVAPQNTPAANAFTTTQRPRRRAARGADLTERVIARAVCHCASASSSPVESHSAQSRGSTGHKHSMATKHPPAVPSGNSGANLRESWARCAPCQVSTPERPVRSCVPFIFFFPMRCEVPCSLQYCRDDAVRLTRLARPKSSDAE